MLSLAELVARSWNTPTCKKQNVVPDNIRHVFLLGPLLFHNRVLFLMYLIAFEQFGDRTVLLCPDVCSCVFTG